jgi:ketosteroid isomerase-like protein
VKGDLGWDWADFHVTPEDKSQAPFTFKILFLWERRNGEWICVGDIYVMDKPGAAAGATAGPVQK